MKHYIILMGVVFLFGSSTDGKKKLKKIVQEMDTELDRVSDEVGELQEQRTVMNQRLDKIEALLRQLNETCSCSEDEPVTPVEVEVEQWVTSVTGYSSQYNDNSWSANQVVGPANVYPSYGDLTGTWAQKNLDANQYIELHFSEALFISRIDIYETLHAGGVKAVSGKNPNGQWEQLYSTDQVVDIQASRIFSPELQEKDYPISDIRVDVDCTAARSWVELDAVKMVGTKGGSD